MKQIDKELLMKGLQGRAELARLKIAESPAGSDAHKYHSGALSVIGGLVLAIENGVFDVQDVEQE